MRHSILLFAILLFAIATSRAQAVGPLARRAVIGATLAAPVGTEPARVSSVVEGSPLQLAGLRVGDRIVEINGVQPKDAIHFQSLLLALRGDERVRMTVRRDQTLAAIEARLAPMPREVIAGVDTVYSHVVNPNGLRQRALLTRPATITRRLPAILFVPWFSCDSMEFPNGPRPGMSEFLHRIAAESGFVMLRIDKPGVGDSEGDCASSDLDTEIAGSRAGLEMLRTHEWVDPSRIIVMGQSFSGAFLPQVARDIPVAGYVFINSWSRTWMERLIEFERRNMESSGTPRPVVFARIRKLSEFYALFLEQRKTPGTILRERPDLKDVWNEGPDHQYGRSARFLQQLQAIDPGTAWAAVKVPTLVMWGDADIVMHRQDHERLVAIVNANGPGLAELQIIPGADHGLVVQGPDRTPRLAADAVDHTLAFLKRFSGSNTAATNPGGVR